MKTKIIRRLFMNFIILIFSISGIKGQTTPVDSVIHSKKLEFLSGTIPLHYSARCENRAKEVHSVLTNVVETYSDQGDKTFQLKLAVLDSSQWTFSLPYGFFFINNNWIVIPGDMTYQKAARLYGFESFSEILLENLQKKSKTPEDLIDDMLYNFIIIHELGHYYAKRILGATPPDRWTNEWMASYFSTDFLFHHDKSALATYGIFTKTYAKEFEPRYRTLSDFNRKYTGVGIKNYFWYQSMFQPMIEDIYSAYQGDFMNLFARTFPHSNKPIKYSREEILERLDHLTEGRTSKWVAVMEGRGE
jgi:hypothetical protein